MNKIQFLVSLNACFVYHMLSVAQCGYDNAHGVAWRHIYPPEDLGVLKKYEDLLTVCGGKHCGSLYWYLIAQPACGGVPGDEFYRTFPYSPQVEEVKDLFHEIQEICSVMERSYAVFMECVWLASKTAIEDYIRSLSDRFMASGFTDLAEQIVGCTLQTPVFYAVMTDSMENGAEAIDIAPDMDVFSITRPQEQAYAFIAHEYVIYLLKIALRDTSAFKSFETWSITEALAEYYLKQILGDTGMFKNQGNWIRFYEELKQEKPNADAVSLYLAAEESM